MNDIAIDTIGQHMAEIAAEGNIPTVEAPAIAPELEALGQPVVQDTDYSADPLGN